MRVLVTGGSGFLGSHIVAALRRAGHAVRVLALDPAEVGPALAPHGVHGVQLARGDVTELASVEQALEGCDAVIHAANVYTLDPRRWPHMVQVNRQGTENVLSAAVAAGCDPVVHVSSVVTLYPARGPIPADAPLGGPWPQGYVQSKVDAERIARRLQAHGAPVVTTYPGSAYGAYDPVPGEQVHILNALLHNRLPFHVAQGGVPCADVGWLARAHAALIAPGRGPRRVTLGGRHVAMAELYAALRRLTGQRLPLVAAVPAPVASAVGRLADRVQRSLAWRLPLSYESVWSVVSSAPTDDRVARSLVGPPPPLEETLREAVRWAVGRGHVGGHAGGVLREG